MSSNEVGYTEGLTVKKYIRGEMNQETIEGPRAQREYVTYFNDVEKMCMYISTVFLCVESMPSANFKNSM